MAGENETKISDAVGPMNAESPTGSPTGVPALSGRVDCYLYVMECEGHVKIGYAQSPIARMGVHQVGNPFPITLTGVVKFDNAEQAKSAEERALSAYRHLHVRGEWHLADARKVLTFIRIDAGLEPPAKRVRREVPYVAAAFDYDDWIHTMMEAD